MQPPQYPGQPPYPAPPPPRQKSWLARNLAWLVPVGCLGVLLAFGLFIAGILGVVAVSMRSSDVYREAMARASSDPRVQSELGAPIEAGFFVSGSVRVSGPTGSADLSIPISGPRKEGTIYAAAQKTAGRWTFSTLEVEVDGNPTRIPLLSATAPP